ncbi:MAG: 2-polyprenyl-3-methyl-6-methoxy-1,4-benzoquinone monooxygenase [Gammaproteobacteria bacterium]|nr:2-polyprenyl-3-methyl-6-methoxy-1,4-benzoquinone monooxygenase [Gammaproteobacteria bacterium]
MTDRRYDKLDQIIIEFDKSLAALFPSRSRPNRANPAAESDSSGMNETEIRVSQGFMRINHAGEVSAQALYQGQALTARSSRVKALMQHAADEELDHLSWCKTRLDELHSYTSHLNPIWYLGSFSIGALAGLSGDKWSLGFIAETENQVESHLQKHLDKLPAADTRSRAILEQMQVDEAEHAQSALDSGAAELPAQIKKIMSLCSKVMTTTAYWI